jgi:hypothetical protein
VSAACRRRWLLVSSTACSALALAACGGESRGQAEASFSARVGSALAAQANRVASRLEAGDADGARSAGAKLDLTVARAIAAGQVPSALRQPLQEAVDEILASIPAPPPAPTTTAEEDPGDEKKDDDKGKGHDEDKGGKGNGNGSD